MLRAIATRPLRCAWLLSCLALPALGCKAGAVADKLRPTDPSANEALGRGTCTSVAEGAEPMVVDWQPEQRGDLEVAMRDGVAVVAYSCEALRLLPDCHIEGTYGFIGMTRKEQVVRLTNDDEVRVNLPLSQGKIGGELARDASIDVAMIMVGKQRTTWQEPTTADLQGSCEGATHYVRGATVGAFVVELSTAAQARAAAEMFKVGASAGSSSAKESRNQDGDPAECAKATPDASEPPAQCGAPIRIVLAPIAQNEAEAEAEAAAASLVATVEPACPSGYVLSEGKCTSAQQAQTYQCSPHDRAECETQCGRGHAGSCSALGVLYAAAGEHPRAAEAWRKACDGGDTIGCGNLGLLVERGQGTAKDPAEASALFQQCCDDGIAMGCEGLGRAALAGVGGQSPDPARAIALFRQGCEGGQDTACAAAAEQLAKSSNKVQRLEALELHQRACRGTVTESCLAAGRLLEERGGAAGAAMAEPQYRRACILGLANGCFEQGRVQMPRNADAAQSSFKLACNRQSKLGCAALVVGYGDKRPFVPDVQQKQALQTGCNKGDATACGRLGLIDAASGSPTAKQHLGRACRQQDPFACAMAKKLE